MNMPPQMGMSNGGRPGQFPPGFPNQQVPRQMNPPGLPMQQQQQQGLQPTLMAAGMPQSHMHQPLQAVQLSAQQQMQGMDNFSPEENQIINHLARQMAGRATQQEMESIRAKINAMPPARRQALDARKIDPLLYWFREQAIRQYVTQKRMQQPGQQMLQPGQNPQRAAVAPNLINRTPQQGPMPGGAQNFDEPFGDTQQMNQIMDLQRQGFKGQVDGRTVVPASQQSLGQQPGSRGSQGQTPFSQAQTPRPMSSTQAPRGQQNGLMGQNGSLNGPMAQALHQHSPAMQTLNQPMAPAMQRPPSQNASQPNQQPPNPTSTPSRNLQVTPQLPQHPQGGVSDARSSLTQQRLMQMNVPLATRQKILTLPPDQQSKAWNALVERQRQAQMQRQQQQQDMNRNGAVAAAPAPASQAPMVPNQQFQQRPAGPIPNMHGLSNGQMAMSGNQNNPQGNFPPNAAMGLRTQQPPQLQRPATAMTEEQIRDMDRREYPPTILHSAILMQHMSQDVKTWGDLKSWVSTHLHLMPADILEKLKDLQGLHFTSLMNRQQQQQRFRKQVQEQAAGQPGQPMNRPGPAQPVAPVAPMALANGNSASVPKQPFNQGGQISVQDLSMWRAKFPQLREMHDDQVRQLIIKKRAEQANNAAVMRQQCDQTEAQMNAKPSSSTPFSVSQPQANGVGPGSQAGQAGKLVMMQGSDQQPQGSNRSPAQVPSAKGIKRPNSDEVVEVPNPASDLSQGPRPADNLTSTPQKTGFGSDASKVPQRPPVTQAGKAPQVSQQPNKVPQMARAKGDPNARRARYLQIKEEVQKSIQSKGPIQMDAQTKSFMTHLLVSNAAMVQRTEIGITKYFMTFDVSEDVLRDLLGAVSLIILGHNRANGVVATGYHKAVS